MTPPVLMVGVALFTWGIGEGMFIYFAPLYMQQFGASPIWIGSILGGYGFVMMCAHIPAGLLSDIYALSLFLIALGVVFSLVFSPHSSSPVAAPL